MIKYIGSKRVLLPRIVAAVQGLQGVRSAADLFSGTSRVGHALKRAGFQVAANDHLSYAHTLAACHVAADSERWSGPAERLLNDLAHTAPSAGYFTEVFCIRSRFFHPRNGERIDAIRERIAAMGLEPELEAIALTSLMEAADRVDSTTGLQMAYLKQWAPRAANPLELRLPDMLPGVGRATQLDALEAAAECQADVAYLDPPYNQHSYLGNYHVWETLVRWDKPEFYGTACKRVDCRQYHTPYNSKREIRGAIRALLEALQTRFILVSFNNEGYLDRCEMEDMLSAHGHVEVVDIPYKRYVGAQIGIFNPDGEKVGRVSHLTNKEYLYLVGPSADAVRAAAHGASAPPPDTAAGPAQLSLF